MPELRSLVQKPASAGRVTLPQDGPRPGLDRFLGGMMGDQLPGDAASGVGALAALVPMWKLLKMRLKVPSTAIVPGPTNTGDQLLREHVMTLDEAKEILSHRMREFIPPGDEGGNIRAVLTGLGSDGIEQAYQKILGAGGRPVPSPGGPPSQLKVTNGWPSEADLDQLRAQLARRPPRPTRPPGEHH